METVAFVLSTLCFYFTNLFPIKGITNQLYIAMKTADVISRHQILVPILYILWLMLR